MSILRTNDVNSFQLIDIHDSYVESSFKFQKYELILIMSIMKIVT